MLSKRGYRDPSMSSSKDNAATRRFPILPELSARTEYVDFLLAESPAFIYTAEISEGLPVTFVSENIENVLGVPAEQITENPRWWEQNCHPDDKQRVVETVEHILERSQAGGEFRYMHGDGSYHWFLHQGRLVAGKNNGKLHFIGTAIDITDKKKAQSDLAQSEELFRRLFDDSPIGIGLVSTEFRLLHGNGRLCEILGYSESELKQMSFEDATHPDDIAMEAELASKLISGELPSFHISKRFIAKDGRVIPGELTASLVRDADGRPAYCLGMIQDVSERIHAQRERDGIFELSPSLICTVGFDGTLRLVNPAFEKTLGYEKDELCGVAYIDLVHPDDREDLAQIFDGLKSEPRTRGRESRWLKKDGSFRWLSWRLAAIPEASVMCAVGHDVSNRVKEEEALRRRREQAEREQRILSMGAMASEMAQQLQQPLSAMVNYAGGIARVLDGGNSDTEKALHGARQIVAEGLRVGEIIKRIDAFIRHSEARPRWIDIEEVIERAAKMFRLGAGSTLAELSIDIAAGLPPLKIDPLHIEQVVINLLRNALEAAEQEKTAGLRIDLSVSEAGDESVEVRVRDNGPGFDPGEADHIFDAFLGNTDSQIGMGLPTSRRIIEAHGGRIWAKNLDVGGAEFGFFLPCDGFEGKDSV